MDPIPAMDVEGALECENCGCRTHTVRVGIGTFCTVCLSKLLRPDWLFDPGLWNVIIEAWREKLALGHPIRCAGE